MQLRFARGCAALLVIFTVGCASNPAMRPHAAARAEREDPGTAPPPESRAEPARVADVQAASTPESGAVPPAPTRAPVPASATRPAPAVNGWWPPVPGTDRASVISRFGDPRGASRTHEGIDIAAPRGTPVLAPTAGKVLVSGPRSLGGNVVVLLSDDGAYEFVFTHLEERAVARGVRVRGGDLLGYVGTTGNAAGGPPHLHFEVHAADGPVDPYPLLSGVLPARAGQ